MAIKKVLKRVVYSPEEVAEIWGVSKSWVYAGVKRGDIPSLTMPGGRLIRIPAQIVEKFGDLPESTAD